MLREQAAIAAMQALIPSAEQCVSPSAMAASWATCYADALLAELARTSPVRPEPTVPMGTTVLKDRHGIPTEVVRIEMPNLGTKNAQATQGTCTTAERELIEASISSQITNNFQPWYAAIEAVRAERRAASEAKGGEQP